MKETRQCKNCKWYFECKGKDICEEYEAEFSDNNERLDKEIHNKFWRIYVENWDKV